MARRGTCKWAKKPHGFLKFIELILELVCLVLLMKYELFGQNEHTTYLAIIINGGCVLLTLALILLYTCDALEPWSAIGEMVIHIINAILFFIIGANALAWCLDFYSYCEKGPSYVYSIFSFIIMATLIADAVFSYRNRKTTEQKK